jgi:hypothetical protein
VELAREQQHIHGGHGWIRGGFDLIVAVLLGLTVIAIAWGAYQAELKAKDADHYFNRSDETLGTAHKLELQGDQEVSTYEQLFIQLEQSKAEGRIKAVAYLRRRLITPGLQGAITWWEQQPAASRPESPFVDENPHYRNAFYDRGGRLEGLAARYLDRAHVAEESEIDYTIVVVLLTVALFVFGLATQILTPFVKIGLVVFGGLILLGAIARYIDLGIS